MTSVSYRKVTFSAIKEQVLGNFWAILITLSVYPVLLLLRWLLGANFIFEVNGFDILDKIVAGEFVWIAPTGLIVILMTAFVAWITSIVHAATARTYIDAFYADMDRLGILRADIEPKATEHITEMIELCENLIAKGHAYSTPSGDVYFRVRSYGDYGKLSGRNIEDLMSGARIEPGEEKEDPLDFALWKAEKPGEPSQACKWRLGE